MSFILENQSILNFFINLYFHVPYCVKLYVFSDLVLIDRSFKMGHVLGKSNLQNGQRARTC